MHRGTAMTASYCRLAFAVAFAASLAAAPAVAAPETFTPQPVAAKPAVKKPVRAQARPVQVRAAAAGQSCLASCPTRLTLVGASFGF